MHSRASCRSRLLLSQELHGNAPFNAKCSRVSTHMAALALAHTTTHAACPSCKAYTRDPSGQQPSTPRSPCIACTYHPLHCVANARQGTTACFQLLLLPTALSAAQEAAVPTTHQSPTCSHKGSYSMSNAHLPAVATANTTHAHIPHNQLTYQQLYARARHVTDPTTHT
jgi:hypothetical protein